MFFRLFLIIAFFPLQSCSNTLIGEKLENSFDTNPNRTTSGIIDNSKEQNKLKDIKKIKLRKIDNDKLNKNIKENIAKENSISNKDRSSKKTTTNSIKKATFNPQPYRIILKLSGANPSAPAETVTNALRKAGVQFEVEKIERFDEEGLLKDSSLKRQEF
tara:strand:- start:26 stop:505 length:480 start_codon:yes stop_codon:yes gene_type:complete